MKQNLLYKTIWFSTLIIFTLLGAACSGRQRAVSYEFTTLQRGSLERSISASGTINPVSTVRVLPQMSGKVENIFVSNNDVINRGDILAELNTDMLKLRREQQAAAVAKARANYELQLLVFQNQEILAERNFISEFELKTSENTLNNLAADLASAEVNLMVIETEINHFAFISSPIDGIVLERRINIGDTVVDSSSNNSSHMFTLAENLEEMQIEAMVSELDVASIRRGQMVRFTLESMPGRTFLGYVEAIHLIPLVSNNVVSYTVIINTENLDGSLLPGMTCAVDFIVESSPNVLMVSNAALRYQPAHITEEQNNSSAPQGGANTNLANLMLGPSPMMGGGRGAMPFGGGQRQAATAAPATVTRTLWFINSQGDLEAMEVRTGISSGSFTAIYTDEDLEGMQVILRELF
ncbi:MAG: efflux RND transporter periplasmic adaptor subunit [Treponema sp.]|nr:efflux RND transporter periplasmic adaptor subunit [Treponema sp.]